MALTIIRLIIKTMKMKTINQYLKEMLERMNDNTELVLIVSKAKPQGMCGFGYNSYLQEKTK